MSARAPKLTLVLFVLPDGRIVLQRRTQDAPYAAGKLGIFGGWVESGETPRQCLIREITEETSLDTAQLAINDIADFVVPAGPDFPNDRHFFLYSANIPNMDFAVYEGDQAEAFTLEEIRTRTDLAFTASFTFARLTNTNQGLRFSQQVKLH